MSGSIGVETLHSAAKELYDEGKYEHVTQLLRAIPREQLVRDPHLGMIAATALHRLYRSSEAMLLLEDLRPFIYSTRDPNALRRWQNGYALHLCHRGRVAEAERLLSESLGSAEGNNDLRNIGFACNTMGIVAGTIGNWEVAVQLYTRAITAWQQMGDMRSVGLGHFNLSVVLREWGHTFAASTHNFLAQEYLLEAGSPEDRLLMHLERTMLLVALDDNMLAEVSARKALLRATRSKNVYLWTRANRILGTVLLRKNANHEAKTFLEIALESVRSEPNHLLEATIHEDLAVLALAENRLQDAELHSTAALAYYGAIGASNRYERAENRLRSCSH